MIIRNLCQLSLGFLTSKKITIVITTGNNITTYMNNVSVGKMLAFPDRIGCVFSETGVKSLGTRHSCMKSVEKVEIEAEVCKDRDIWHSDLPAYPYGDSALYVYIN